MAFALGGLVFWLKPIWKGKRFVPKINVSIVSRIGSWQDVRDAARNTVWKGGLGEKEVSSEFKRKMLMSEHSPIRCLQFRIRIESLPYWVSVHLVRHKLGFEHFVSTQRDDRQVTGAVMVDAVKDIFADMIRHYAAALFKGKTVPRRYKLQGELVNHEMLVNAQSLIFLARKRLCYLASPETTQAVREIQKVLREGGEPELADVMVPECVYRGFCTEEPCKSRYAWTPKFLRDLANYRSTIGRK